MEALPNGVYAASLTPLKNNLAVNFDKLSYHCESLIDHGCNGVVLMGTTGEANSFDLPERQSILETVLESTLEPHQVMVGTGCCSLSETVALTKHALEHNVNHVLVLPPFYYRSVDDDGLFRYFDELINRCNHPDLKIFLYHFPRMTGLPFSHGLIEKLLKLFPDVITGIKDSSGDWDNMTQLRDKFPDLRVFTGSEVFLLDILKRGGSGTVSASVNVNHKCAVEVFRHAGNTNGEYLQEKLTSIRRAIEKYPVIPVLKLIMSQTENDEEWLNIRPPLMPLALWNEDEIKEIRSAINGCA